MNKDLPQGWRRIKSIADDECHTHGNERWEFLDFKGNFSVCNYAHAVIGQRIHGKFHVGDWFVLITFNDSTKNKWFLQRKEAENWLREKMCRISEENFIDSIEMLRLRKKDLNFQTPITFFLKESD